MPSILEPEVTTLSDGVQYRFNDEIETVIKVAGTPKSASVRVSIDGAIIPPLSGNLESDTFRAKVCAKVTEKLANTNGFPRLLDAVSSQYREDLDQREKDAAENDRESNVSELVGTPYRVRNGGLERIKQTNQGEVPQQLTNFIAKVDEEIVRDDGAETRRYYRINGRTPESKLPAADVPASHFPTMKWVHDAWGLSAHLTAGPSVADYTREAIQLLSKDAKKRHVFQHTGFRDIDGKQVYLHARGGVGRQGVEVELDTPLQNYGLPYEVQVGVIREALKTALCFLDVAPDRVTFPLLAMGFLAPISSIIPPDFTLWFHGATGNFKSTLAALVLSLFGDFTEDTLPISFESTPNFMERVLFILKDVLTVVDDWRPAVGRADEAEMNRRAQRLLRGVGNRQGRGRLNSDTTAKHAYVPRGAVIATAEGIPEGPAFQSATQRSLSVALKGEWVDLALLSELQAKRSVLPAVMYRYVEYVSENYTAFSTNLPALVEINRSEFRKDKKLEGAHPRIYAASALLLMALATFAEFAEKEAGLDYEKFIERAYSAIVEAAAEHIATTKGDDPATRFITLLRSLFAADRAYLKDTDGGHPLDFGKFGWVRRGDDAIEPERNASFVGWVDEHYVYLDKDQAFAAVAGFAQRGDIAFGIKPRVLWRSLKDASVSVCDQGRTDSRVTVAGKRHQSIKLSREVVFGADDE